MSRKREGSGLHCLFQRIGKSGQGEIKIAFAAFPARAKTRAELTVSVMAQTSRVRPDRVGVLLHTDCLRQATHMCK